MNISKIDINNFRLLKQTSINCEKELSLIIGKNNCGKTSLLSALSKCIGSKSEVGKFNYFDFFYLKKFSQNNSAPILYNFISKITTLFII